MSNLLFWKDWPSIPKYLYSFLLLVFVTLTLAYGYAYYQEGRLISSWTVDQQLDLTKTKLDEVHIGMFSIPIEGQLYLNYANYEAGIFKLPLWVYTIYGIILILVSSFLLSIISTLRSLWFAIGMTLFIFYLSVLNLDYVIFLGSYTQVFLIISLVVYIAVGYYLHAFQKNLSLGWRVCIFSLVTLGLGSLLFLNSHVNNPTIFLVNYGAWVPLIITLLFITISAQDIVRSFFYLISNYNPQGGRSNLVHFTVITFFYLANLLLIFLKERAIFEIDIYYLDVYWLLAIGSILGIWGYQKRQVLIQRILPFDYQAAFGYICLAILSLATITFYMFTANDAMTDVFKDFILFSYIGYGLTFYIYIMINFSNLIDNQANVNAFLYEGKVIPMSTLRYFGLIVILGFFLNVKQMLYYQGVSGYYNGLADIYYHHKDYKMANLYYTHGKYNDYLNHRSNFALASLAQFEEDKEEEFKHLKIAIRRQPSEFAYIRMGQLLLENDKKFDALFTLREGLGKFPQSHFLLNNLASLYKINDITDSTLFYLEKAAQYSNSNIIQNNIWAYLAEKTVVDDSIQAIQELDLNAQDLYGKINALAYFTKNKKTIDWENSDASNFTEINAEQFAFLQNYTLNHIGAKSPQVDSLLSEFSHKDSLGFFSHEAQFIQACYQYYHGQVYTGIQSLASIPILPTHGYYNTVLGLWLLEQKAFAGAITYFDKAIKLKNTLAPFYKAIALSEAHQFDEAIPLWAKLTQKDEQNPEVAQFAQRILRVFQDSLELNDDVDKYNFLHYKKHIISKKTQIDVYNSITDPNYRVRAGVEMAQYYMSIDSLILAGQYVENVNAIKVDNPFVASEQNLVNLQMALRGGLYEEMLQQIDQVKLLHLHQNQLPIIRARAYEILEKEKESEQYYLEALESTPFDEETILNSAAFFQEVKKDNQKAYDILVNSVRSNPFSLKIYKAYALIALKVGLSYYGDDALEDIRKLTHEEDYQNFVKEYKKQKEELGGNE